MANKDWEVQKGTFQVVDGRGKGMDFMPIFLEKAKQIELGDGITVIQNFEPVPLYPQMTKLGFDYVVEKIADDQYRAYFYREKEGQDGPTMSDRMSEHVEIDKDREKAIIGIVLDFFQKGESVENLEKRFDKELGSIKASEFAFVEQKVKEYGVPEENLEYTIEDLINIFKKSLDKSELEDFPAGHPIHTFVIENRAIEQLVNEMKAKLKEDSFDAEWWQNAYEKLWQVNNHYLRKEHQLFPKTEEKGFDMPSTLMWTLQDNIRKLIKEARNQLINEEYDSFIKGQEQIFTEVMEMIFKEEKILFPTVLEMLTVEEWGDIRTGEEEIGYCLIQNPPMWYPDTAGEEVRQQSVQPGEQNEKAAAKPFKTTKRRTNEHPVGAIRIDEGYLTIEQINLMLKHLPIDISFVDEHDRVRFYSKGEERVFPRSPGDIGREVKYCHPPKSVDTVMKILDEFKAGNKDVADFWIEHRGQFLYIRYFAVRDEEGNYKGVLEMMQDVSEIRKLEGEQRLLDWE